MTLVRCPLSIFCSHGTPPREVPRLFGHMGERRWRGWYRARSCTSPSTLRMRFRGGVVFEAHRLLYHSTLGLRVIKKKKKVRPTSHPPSEFNQICRFRFPISWFFRFPGWQFATSRQQKGSNFRPGFSRTLRGGAESGVVHDTSARVIVKYLGSNFRCAESDIFNRRALRPDGRFKRGAPRLTIHTCIKL